MDIATSVYRPTVNGIQIPKYHFSALSPVSVYYECPATTSFLSTGPSFPLARQLQQIDDELLDIRHVEDPAFLAFVSLEVLRSVLSFTLRDLLRYLPHYSLHLVCYPTG